MHFGVASTLNHNIDMGDSQKKNSQSLVGGTARRLASLDKTVPEEGGDFRKTGKVVDWGRKGGKDIMKGCGCQRDLYLILEVIGIHWNLLSREEQSV